MNRILSIVAISTIAFASACTPKTEVKNCVEPTLTAPADEVAALQTYIESNNIAATFDERGFYYRIVDSGQVNKPGYCSAVTLDYTGKLTNNTTFDANNNASFDLMSVTSGFRMAVPLIGIGGDIIMYLPPTLGYGSEDYGSIPGGSILIFRVKLNTITKQ